MGASTLRRLREIGETVERPDEDVRGREVHDAEKAGAIVLKDDQCTRFVVEVADPAAAVAAIATAIHVPRATARRAASRWRTGHMPA